MGGPGDALLAAENPFADPVARLEATVPPPPDVESVHGAIRAELRRAIESVGAGRAQMVMVKGDPGMGKTHELLCLQREAHKAQRGFHFVDIPPLKDAGAPFRHVLRHFIQGLTGQGQLERLLWDSLRRVALALRDAAWEDGDEPMVVRLDDVLLGGAQYVGAFRTLIQGDRPLGDELYRRGRGLLPLSSLSAELGRVLTKLPDRTLQPLVGEWLRGAELPDEDLAALGVRASLDTEARCFEVLQGLVKLSPSPVALGFDQLESTSGLLGTVGAAALFHALMEIYQQLPVCIVLMCQTQHWAELRPHLPQAAVERVRDLGTLQKPTAEEAARLVGGRMAPLWKAAGVSPPYPTYPFPRPYLDAHVAQTRPTIRGLFLALGDRVEEMRRQKAVLEPGGAPPPAPRAPDAREVLAREHARRAAEVMSRPDSREPSQRQERLRSVMAQLLAGAAARGARVAGARVVEVSDPPQPARGARPSLVAVFGAADGTRRVAFEVYGDKPLTVHFPLKRLCKKLEDGEVEAAFLVRETVAPLDPVGKVGKELLWWLTPRGGVVWLDERVVSRLVGGDLLLDAVSASEVSLGSGGVVTRDAALDYLLAADDLGAALAPWLSQVVPVEASMEDRLRELLGTKAILPLERAAELLGASLGAVEQAAQTLVDGKRAMKQTGKDGRMLLVRLGGAR